MIELSAFDWVPEMSRGYVRDLRVRWALEEVGVPYRALRISHGAKRSDEYLAWQPFGQVPAMRSGGLEMFESGAIVVWLAQRHEGLCPPDERARARMTSWVFAAVDSLGSRIDAYTALDAFHAGEPWVELRRPTLRAALEDRLDCLSRWLGDRDHLEDVFTAGDLMVSFALRELSGGDLLATRPNLQAYVARCVGRPAFARALAAQLSDLSEDPGDGVG